MGSLPERRHDGACHSLLPLWLLWDTIVSGICPRKVIPLAIWTKEATTRGMNRKSTTLLLSPCSFHNCVWHVGQRLGNLNHWSHSECSQQMNPLSTDGRYVEGGGVRYIALENSDRSHNISVWSKPKHHQESSPEIWRGCIRVSKYKGESDPTHCPNR